MNPRTILFLGNIMLCKLYNLTFDMDGSTCFYAGLKGELKLKKLQRLSLAQNQLTEIPSLGALLSLNYLNLANNYLNNLSDFNSKLNFFTATVLT